MGKIKKEIIVKKDRPITESKPPSLRRIKRSNRRAIPRTDAFSQRVPDMVLFRFKKKHRPIETVVHAHYSDERKDKTSTRRTTILKCKSDDSVRIAQLELMVKQGLGKIETKKRKIIWHRVDKQDGYYKPTLPYYKGNTGRRKL